MACYAYRNWQISAYAVRLNIVKRHGQQSATRRTLTTREEIQSEVLRCLKRYEKFNFFEQFVMFIGVVQVIEISLKQLLHRKYEVEFESLERSALGQVARLLKDRGLRPDFTASLLDSVVGYRNHVTHSLLANQIMLQSLGAGDARFEQPEVREGYL
jgi:hypothetical protein